MRRAQLIAREIFYFFTLLTIVSLILEIIWPHIILAHFNLNWLFSLWLLSALFLLSKK